MTQITDKAVEVFKTAYDSLRPSRNRDDDIRAALTAALPHMQGWQGMATAKKDRTPIFALMRNDLATAFNRPDLERWQGRQVVINHVGLADDGFDFGWGVDAPVGHGGLPDEWFVGWQPLPPPPKEGV